jgi:hypothetical protein
VVEDAVSAEKGGQWLFSCYAPLLRRVINKNQESSTNQNQETLPGMEDYSPEELRWSWMESQSSPGQNQEYMAKLQLLTQTHQNIRRALQNPDKPTSNYIVRTKNKLLKRIHEHVKVSFSIVFFSDFD